MPSCSASVLANSAGRPATRFTTPPGRSLGIEQLVHVADDERILSEGTATTVLPTAIAGSTSESKPSSGASDGRKNPDRAHRLIHRNGNVASRRMVHHAVVLVGPRRRS